MLFLLKKLDKLALGELKDKCFARVTRLASKLTSSQSKGDAAIKICRSLLKVAEDIPTPIPQGFLLLEFIKALTMEVHEVNQVEVYLVKIRTYLLTIRWSRMQRLPLSKLISRAALFIEQMKATPLFEAIAGDFYSHLERLYLEIIQESVRSNALGQAGRLMSGCFEALKAQINNICALFDSEEKKLFKLAEKKVELLEILFKYEHGIKFITGILEPDQVTAQILPRYERITSKIPTIHFPTQSLLAECEAAWVTNTMSKSIKQSSLSRRAHSLSESATNCRYGSGTKERHHESFKETVEYLNDFFRKRSMSAAEPTLDLSPLKLPASNASPGNKKSYFQREKLEHLNLQTTAQKGSSNISKLKDSRNIQKQRAKSFNQIIEPKKFKLVLEMDCQAREKMIKANPFARMSHAELSILSNKKQALAGDLIVC